MRELTYIEGALVAGASNAERNEDRKDMVESGILVGTMLGGYVGAEAAGGISTLYTLGGMTAGIYAGIIVVPVLAKVGLELGYAVYDTLAP